MKRPLLLFLLFIGLSVAVQAQVNTRGVSHEINQAELRVFPNPAIDDFEISANEHTKLIRVFNLVGQRVKQYTYDRDRKYYVGDLPRGTYLVQLIGSNNKTLVTRRLNKK